MAGRTDTLVLCAAQLAAAIAPASLPDALRGLRVAGVIESYEIAGGEVRVVGDPKALELAVQRLDEDGPVRLGDDAERGFRVSSDVNGRRGSPTAKAADVTATGAYYDRAGALLHDPSLSPRARRIWELHADGLSEEKIAARLGMARRRVVQQLAILRCRAGLTRKVAGWATRTDAR